MEKQESSSMAMRLYATWDVDRATPSTVPRIFNVSVNRILVDCVSPEVNSIIVTAKLPLSKRNRYLRSNEIKVTPVHGRIDLDCDISFCIQYPHFLKRKSNVLQFLIQRRKKYKNRLPGGFRDLAVGNINLSYIMQQGGLREIPLNASTENEVELKGMGPCSGKMFLASCYSQAPEVVDDRDKQKKNVEDSEDETETDYDDVGDELNDIPSGRSGRHKTTELEVRPGRTKGKNLKYQMNKLFNMFRPEDGRRPVVKEMPWEDDDLESPYDSGPELFNDDASIRSNQRPQLAPFFDPKEKSENVLAAMYEVSDGEVDQADGGWNSEPENTKENVGRNKLIHKDSVGSSQPEQHAQTPSRSTGMRIVSSSFDSHTMPHSSTLNSIKNEHGVHRGVSLSEQLSSILGSSMYPEGSESVWLCSLSEWPTFASLAGPVPIVNCPTFSQVRQTLSHVINRIQNFCHSNSSNPPLTIVGIIGTDKLISQVVKAYVECLAHKSLANLINHLRFIAIPATSSLFYKLIEAIDPQLDNLCRDLWDRWGDMNPAEKSALASKIAAWPKSVVASKMNLPIGEAMLQLTADRDPEGGRVFLPFLCEVRVGSQQCDIENDEDSNGVNGFTPTIVSPREESAVMKTDGSPPHSPQLRNVDGQELSMDFWLNNPVQQNAYTYGADFPTTSSTTPNSKKEAAKVTIKAHFRTLLVKRSPSSGSLSLTYLKEKRKDKMLQKLGMKKGQKQKPEDGPTPSQVPSIGRMLCSASGKHNELTDMGDRTARIGMENCGTILERSGRYPITPCTRLKPPSVNKIDGRARILRPLRQATGGGMQPSQQPTASTSSGGSGRQASSSMHHSQSMPVLQSGNPGARTASNQPTGRAALTLPSNSTEKILALLQWAEVLKKQMERMRKVSKKALEHAQSDVLTMTDLSRVREGLTEIANVYSEMEKTARTKCRTNAIFDKRGLYKSVEASLQNLKIKDPKTNYLFDKMQESMDEKFAIERNLMAVSESFRQNAVVPHRISRLAPPPPITFSKHVEDANKGVWRSMEAVLNKVRGDPMTWKFRRISHPFFRNSKCLIQVHYCSRRPSGEKEFVPFMKAIIVLKYGILEDLVIGGEDEELYDTERILQSKRIVYQEFTKSAREIILCSPVTKFITPTNFAQCNNYIQTYVNCFSTKCFYCKKHLRQFMPPTVVTREFPSIICHRLCQMVQLP